MSAPDLGPQSMLPSMSLSTAISRFRTLGLVAVLTGAMVTPALAGASSGRATTVHPVEHGGKTWAQHCIDKGWEEAPTFYDGAKRFVIIAACILDAVGQAEHASQQN